ncbi:MAG: endonuclease/exonuclease/phosphatase family protein, partial [Cyanobacteria bacterium J06582_2]
VGIYENRLPEHTLSNIDELISKSNIVQYTKNELLKLRDTNIGSISIDSLEKLKKLNLIIKTKSYTPKENVIHTRLDTDVFIENDPFLSVDFSNRPIFEQIIDIAKDGNCFFRCISQFLYNTQEYHKDIRKSVVQTLKNKREYYTNYIDGNFDDHIRFMSEINGRISSWATEAEIIASSEAFGADVFIKDTRRNQEWLRYSRRLECDHNIRYITILYESNHYSLIKNIHRPCRCGSRDPNQINLIRTSSNCSSNRKTYTKPTRNPQNLIKLSMKENDETEINSNHPLTKKNMNKHKVSMKKISFMSININGIRGKKNILAAFLDTNKPDIVAIQETKIDDTFTSSEIIPKECNYIIYRKDRSDGGGGVMLLIKNNIKQVSLAELDNASESIWVKIKIDGCFHYIGNWYRNPQGNAQDIENLKS